MPHTLQKLKICIWSGDSEDGSFAAGLVDCLEGQFAVTWLPEGLTSSELRRLRPVLWLSVLCAGATISGSGASLSQALSAHMQHILDERLAPDAELSPEVLRALPIYIFYHYELTLNRLPQFFHYVRRSMEMACHLADSKLRHLSSTELPEACLDDSVVEVCREYLVAYWVSMM